MEPKWCDSPWPIVLKIKYIARALLFQTIRRLQKKHHVLLSVSVSLFSFKNFLILFFMMIWKWNFLLMCPKWLHLLYICGWFYRHYGFRFYKTCHLSLIWALSLYCIVTTMLLNVLTPPCNWHDPKTSTMVGRVLTLLKEVWFYVWYNHYISGI